MATFNFILNSNGSIRTTQFTPSNEYNIEDINFYVPAQLADNNSVFLVMKNQQNLYEIIELVRSKGTQSVTNILYKVSLKQNIRVNNESVKMYLLLINNSNGEFTKSSVLSVKILTNNFDLTRQIYISQQMTEKMQKIHMQILDLTKKNLEIYEKIKEREKNIYEDSL